MRIESFLSAIAQDAFREVTGKDAPALLKRAQDPKHGDYQVNGALPLAKAEKKNPRELAEPLARALAAHPAIEKAEVAGPGFVNLTLAPAFLGETVSRDARDARLGVPPAERRVRTVVDYSSPNIAKQMHVGHLRSTIIGHAICETLAFVGEDVVRDNHVGDWGTQYGLLIAGLRRFGGDGHALDLAGLEAIYKQASALAEAEPAFAELARGELAKLQRGDAENRALWERFVAITRRELDKVYERLGVRFDTWYGESFYEPMLPGVVQQLEALGLARRDQGALCVFFGDDVWEGVESKLRKQKEPFIVQKKDGAFLYSTTDLATLLHRRDEVKASKAIYVVDHRQSLHFEQLFAVARRLGVALECHHVGFGTMLGPDGKPLKTRDASGKTITLAALLDEAESRALELMKGAEVELPASELPAVARSVGIGAVKYADLRQNRLSDYQFDWSKMIELKGNSGPYIQYAGARAGAIFRKGEVDRGSVGQAPAALADPAELALAKVLVRFGDVVHASASELLPHLVTDHLYAVARELSSFYERCPVLKAEGEARAARLTLVALAAGQIEKGLSLLGIDAVERM